MAALQERTRARPGGAISPNHPRPISIGRAPLGDFTMAYDEETAERVRRLLSARRDVVARKMMGGLCFMVGGSMCCVVSGKGGLLVRVGPDAFARALGEPYTAPMEMRGRVMTGYVRVAPDGYRTDSMLKKWVERGVAFVTAMPKDAPKKTAANKSAAKQPAAKPKPPRLVQWQAKKKKAKR
ncbi:TfoX/Sxy family protein [Bradyrhizobium sp.]|uniref:TfoX/Sxy family protein n=1 Tax=Bradyrhizobium sp. TaxID=376 RepID=UPI001D656B9A|nr:TfoX/Sxy family protein [Bradyrhizobium sp.]MBV8698053.1 TfoX/Sxy family protein [Bradyrhizobium sp.]MBV8922045.1 TfoX/Sxy family protein [Bradyrhizobium sp.]MBV9984557.1 TfoX/Sxy family protein [Bradyrhizobium sp.]